MYTTEYIYRPQCVVSQTAHTYYLWEYFSVFLDNPNMAKISYRHNLNICQK